MRFSASIGIFYVKQALNGYKLRFNQELWEKKTGLDYFNDFDAVKFSDLMALTNTKTSIYESSIDLVQFVYFVHNYYACHTRADDKNLSIGGMDGVTLIMKSSSSDEEAFDTFFELYFSYQKEKEKLGDAFMNQYQKNN